jgi:SAM-dependent methyltransferase
VVEGVPHPDPATTLSLLPLWVVGAWLADNAAAVTGDLLDLGAGNQPFRPWYEPLTTSIVAIDAAPAPGLTLVSNAGVLPFVDESFDTVLCTSVLEHVDNVEQAVAELCRVLRPGGRLLITMPFLYPTHEAPHDFWRTTHFGLRSLLTRHGLELGTIAAQGGPLVLVAHFFFGAFGKLVELISTRFGRTGALVDNRFVRSCLAGPQELIGTRLHYRLTGPAKVASLGYMVVATKPSSGPVRVPRGFSG